MERIGGKLISHPQRNNPRQEACQCSVITMSMVCNHVFLPPHAAFAPPNNHRDWQDGTPLCDPNRRSHGPAALLVLCSFPTKVSSRPERNSFFCPVLTEVSSRPERTRISCHAALDRSACAPFCKGKAHEVHQRHQGQQEIRGSVVEGPAVNHPWPQIWNESATLPFVIPPVPACRGTGA
jgi:hypothetical protein